MNRENVMREALSDLEAQRANNIETERQRREEARAKSAEIAALLDERQKLFFFRHARRVCLARKSETDFKRHAEKDGENQSKPACGARQKWFFGELFAAGVSLPGLQGYGLCRRTDSRTLRLSQTDGFK